MTNREGEFVLEIEPGNDHNVISAQALFQFVDVISKVLNFYYQEVDPNQPSGPRLAVLLTASPEYGSIRCLLLVAIRAATAHFSDLMEFGANLSQITGFNAKDAFVALDETIKGSKTPHNVPPEKLDAWYDMAAGLASMAMQSGYSQVVIEDGDRRITLTGPIDNTLAQRLERDALEARLRSLEQHMENVNRGFRETNPGDQQAIDRLEGARRSTLDQIDGVKAQLSAPRAE